MDIQSQINEEKKNESQQEQMRRAHIYKLSTNKTIRLIVSMVYRTEAKQFF